MDNSRRRHSHGHRLHRTLPSQHPESIGSSHRQSQNQGQTSNMATTPIIDESDDDASTSSTTCPLAGRFSPRQSIYSIPSAVSSLSSQHMNDFDDGTIGSAQSHDPEISHDSTTIQVPRKESTHRSHPLPNIMAGLKERLAASTGIINTFRTRNEVHEIEHVFKENELHETRETLEHVKAEADLAVSMGKSNKLALCLVVAFVVLYFCVCWINGPEMSYVRRRRGEEFGL